MATSQMNEVIRHLRRTVFLWDGVGLTDGQLLEAYLSHGEEAALAALVRRHDIHERVTDREEAVLPSGGTVRFLTPRPHPPPENQRCATSGSTNPRGHSRSRSATTTVTSCRPAWSRPRRTRSTHSSRSSPASAGRTGSPSGPCWRSAAATTG